jgi:hypothetical protein
MPPTPRPAERRRSAPTSVLLTVSAEQAADWACLDAAEREAFLVLLAGFAKWKRRQREHPSARPPRTSTVLRRLVGL